MICVTITSFFGMFVATLPILTGMFPVFAASFVMMVSVWLSPSTAARLFWFKTEFSMSTAFSFDMGWVLMTVTRLFNCACTRMVNPAASLI